MVSLPVQAAAARGREAGGDRFDLRDIGMKNGTNKQVVTDGHWVLCVLKLKGIVRRLKRVRPLTRVELRNEGQNQHPCALIQLLLQYWMPRSGLSCVGLAFCQAGLQRFSETVSCTVAAAAATSSHNGRRF